MKRRAERIAHAGRRGPDDHHPTREDRGIERAVEEIDQRMVAKGLWRTVGVEDQPRAGIERCGDRTQRQAPSDVEDLCVCRQILVQGRCLDGERRVPGVLEADRRMDEAKHTGRLDEHIDVTEPAEVGERPKRQEDPGRRPEQILRIGSAADDRESVRLERQPVHQMHRHRLGEAERHGQQRLGMPLHRRHEAVGIVGGAARRPWLEQQQIERHDRGARCRQLGEGGRQRGARWRPMPEPLQGRIVDDQNGDLVARNERRPQPQPEVEACMVERPKRTAVVPAHIADAQDENQHRERNHADAAHPRVSRPATCAP